MQSHYSEIQEASKLAAAEAALQYIQNGALIGLGTGSTMQYLLVALGKLIKTGLQVQGIPTSQETALLAKELNIPILPQEGDWRLDLAIDGADQVDSQFQLIKGGGGALLREKIVARSTDQFIVLIHEDKYVPVLGAPIPIPVEVIPFGWPNTARNIEALGGKSTLRKEKEQVFRTDEGNYILDLMIDRILDPAVLESRLNQIPGVVENGLFVNMTSTLIIGKANGVEIKQPPS